MICLACKQEYNADLVQIRDHFLSQEVFAVSFCPNCELGKTMVPSDIDLAAYYASNDYVSHAAAGRNLLQAIYLLARRFTIKGKTKLIRRFTATGADVLDYGCGTGAFLTELKQAGYHITGIEPDPGARAIAAETTGQSIQADLQELAHDKLYDTITLWHVLEHTPAPREVLERLKSLLKPNGKMVIAVPNHKSRDCQHYGTAWAGYDVPRHLWHFSQESMLRISEHSRLKLIETIPMKLDAYYVSLLSEKYTGSPFPMQWPKAFLSGVQSNLSAGKTGEWSSLIYIFQA